MEAKDKILITGGTGYLGSHLAECLAEKGNDVTALGRKEFNFKNKNICFISKDIRELILEDIKGFNYIFHFAAASFNNSKLEGMEIYKQNVESTLHLLELVKDTTEPLKIIFASSAGVYGRREKKFSEKDGLDPQDLYSCSKSSGELLINTYSKKYPQIKPLILRISNLYGPKQKPGFVISDTIARINQSLGEEFMVLNGGSIRDFIYIEDLISAIEWALEKELTGTYNLGTGKRTRIANLVSQLIALSKKALILREENQNQDANTLNISKIKKEGWTPKINLKKGLKLTHREQIEAKTP